MPIASYSQPKRSPMHRWISTLGGCCAALLILCVVSYAANYPELSRPVRSWEFLPIVGKRAALFGNENGQMEAWVYPIKLLRGFHLIFHVEGRALPAESLVRTVVVHPESATLVYAGDNFSVRETFIVPWDAPGGIILFDVETAQPLEIEAAFIPDFQLEWPAALGGTSLSYDEVRHAFVFAEDQKKSSAILGSPTGGSPQVAYQTNYSSSNESSFRLGVTNRGHERKVIAFTASAQGFDTARANYERLVGSYEQMWKDSVQFYRDYLSRTVQVSLPDDQLQQAYDWSRISLIQGLVENPFVGTGLVAGYRTSGVTQRPGFAWFFGRDSLWTSFALNSMGDLATTRTALDFIGGFQREDGKIPHEISQGTSPDVWFKNYPYGFASADATPLYIIASRDYVVRSGDLEYVRQKWQSLWKAYEFLRSTYDAQGFPQNFGFGHGWVEGGPLLPVKTEFYQSGLGLEAVAALADLAKMAGKDDASKELRTTYDRQKAAFNEAFWSPEKKAYIFGLDRENKRVDELSVLTAVPMWFGVTDDAKAESTLKELAGADHQTDWGMRIISRKSTVYDGSGYHFGSVWPLFTGWASVSEYRYHQTFSAYSNLRANALLALDGSLGHVTEVLSGDYYQPLSTSSPHQIWSAAMVISPVLRGMMGLQTDATKCAISFSPHVPADWKSFSIENVRVGSSTLAFRYRRTPGLLTLETMSTGPGNCTLDFSPALSLRSRTTAVEVNGKSVAFHANANASDQHVLIHAPLSSGANIIQVRLKNDFGLSLPNALPPLGSASAGLRVLGETWNAGRTELKLALSGVAGQKYEFTVWNPSQIASVEGGKLVQDLSILDVSFPQDKSESYIPHEIVIRFAESK
jgi:GH15 family glucan-1,4-alpha-glucosidase